MPGVTSGGEISDLIVTQLEVLSFKFWSLLLFGIDSKYKYHSYIYVTIKTVSNPLNTIEGQITSYFHRDDIVWA